MICFLLDPDQTTECGSDYLTVNDDGVVVNGRDISQGGLCSKYIVLALRCGSNLNIFELKSKYLCLAPAQLNLNIFTTQRNISDDDDEICCVYAKV